MNYYLLALKKYATFSGRSSRKAYWLFMLFNYIIIAILAFPEIYNASTMANNSTPSMLMFLSFIVYSIYVFGTIIPSMAVTVRRLHDIGRSAWNLLFLIIPIIGIFIIFIFCCIKTQSDANKYGDPPAKDE